MRIQIIEMEIRIQLTLIHRRAHRRPSRHVVLQQIGCSGQVSTHRGARHFTHSLPVFTQHGVQHHGDVTRPQVPGIAPCFAVDANLLGDFLGGLTKQMSQHMHSHLPCQTKSVRIASCS
ncbi:MAG: hypothetical protein COA70_00695 [Planctomycetota bacterium]|nr:MAG: hypothetical protein COA70_00695 [Planctomycetota bacterium]